MNDPFKDLREHRQAKERRQQEVAQEIQERAARLQQATAKATEQYDEMVTRVLGRLAEDVYGPHRRSLQRELGIWQLGKWGSDEGQKYFSPNVTVRIILDKQNQPSQFECERKGYLKKVRTWLGAEERRVSITLRCELSEARLVNTLKELHPPESLEWDGDIGIDGTARVNPAKSEEWLADNWPTPDTMLESVQKAGAPMPMIRFVVPLQGSPIDRYRHYHLVDRRVVRELAMSSLFKEKYDELFTEFNAHIGN